MPFSSSDLNLIFVLRMLNIFSADFWWKTAISQSLIAIIIDNLTVNNLLMYTMSMFSGNEIHLIDDDIMYEVHPHFLRFRMSFDKMIDRQYMTTINIFASF